MSYIAERAEGVGPVDQASARIERKNVHTYLHALTFGRFLGSNCSCGRSQSDDAWPRGVRTVSLLVYHLTFFPPARGRAQKCDREGGRDGMGECDGGGMGEGGGGGMGEGDGGR
jgi:hypothetical protein